MKKALLGLCLAVTAVILSVTACAAESLSVISANIAGLPSFASKYDRDVPASQKTLGQMLNASGYDIVCVQEDFGYHDIFAAEMSNYPYQTYTTGGAPVGDGLNIFSVYPFYNVKRVAWEEAHGIFTDGSDAVGCKGFLHCTVDVDGVLIELYNVHMDAYSTEGDQKAKRAQLEQLMAYIQTHSLGRPVLIVGDTNITFHKEPLVEPYRIVIEEGGYTDCWVQVKNNGDYMQGAPGLAVIEKWYTKFGGHDWGRWDSVERVWYRDGGGLSFTPTRFEYVVYSDDPSDVKALTDHRMMECILQLDTEAYTRPADAVLEVPKAPSAIAKIFRAVGMYIRCIAIVLWGGLVYLWEHYPAALIAFVLLVTLLIVLSRKKKKKKPLK